MIHPKAHQSTAYECSPCLTTSGDCYSQLLVLSVTTITKQDLAHQVFGRADERICPVDHNFRLAVPSGPKTSCTCSCPVRHNRLIRVLGDHDARGCATVAKVFRQAKVDKDRVTFAVDQDILWL